MHEIQWKSLKIRLWAIKVICGIFCCSTKWCSCSIYFLFHFGCSLLVDIFDFFFFILISLFAFVFSSVYLYFASSLFSFSLEMIWTSLAHSESICSGCSKSSSTLNSFDSSMEHQNMLLVITMAYSTNHCTPYFFLPFQTYIFLSIIIIIIYV